MLFRSIYFGSPNGGNGMPEYSVLIFCLKDDGSDVVGTFLRDISTGTGGVIVLGKVWVPSVSNMYPYFDQVVCVCEIPVKSWQ